MSLRTYHDELNIRGDIELWANKRIIIKSFAAILITMLLPAFLALLAYWDVRGFSTAYWIAAGISFLLIANLFRVNVDFGVLFSRKPITILKKNAIYDADGIDIPIHLIKEIVVVKAFGAKAIGFVMKPRAFEQMEQEKVKRIKERPAWYMTKFGHSLGYDELTIPGDRVLEILQEKYGLNVRIRAKPMEGP